MKSRIAVNSLMSIIDHQEQDIKQLRAHRYALLVVVLLLASYLSFG